MTKKTKNTKQKNKQKHNQIKKKGGKSKTIMLPFRAKISHPFVAHTNRPWCSRWSGPCCQ